MLEWPRIKQNAQHFIYFKFQFYLHISIIFSDYYIHLYLMCTPVAALYNSFFIRLLSSFLSYHIFLLIPGLVYVAIRITLAERTQIQFYGPILYTTSALAWYCSLYIICSLKVMINLIASQPSQLRLAGQLQLVPDLSKMQ